MHCLLIALGQQTVTAFRLILSRQDYNKVKSTYAGFPVLSYTQAASIVNFQLPSDCEFFMTDGTEDVYVAGRGFGLLSESVTADREWLSGNNQEMK